MNYPWRLFLDDDRYPPTKDVCDWRLARNVDDAMWMIKMYGIPTSMSLDHDLGPSKMDGMDFCRAFIGHLIDVRPYLSPSFDWYVHSQNPVGRDNMINYLTQGIQNYRDGII